MNFDASELNCASVECAVCEKTITGGRWFARIKHGEWMVALCCPLCTEVFQKKPTAYIARIETVAFMRSRKDPSLSNSPLKD
jgi:hypothetical protein